MAQQKQSAMKKLEVLSLSVSVSVSILVTFMCLLGLSQKLANSASAAEFV